MSKEMISGVLVSQIEQAKKDGWAVNMPKIIGGAVTFERIYENVWKTRKGWCHAIITNNLFHSHQYFDTLEEALNVKR